MALHKSRTANGRTPVQSLLSGLASSLMYNYVTGTTVLATGDIIELGPVEQGVRVIDVTLVTDDLDSNGTPTISLAVGILNADSTDLDAAATSTWIAASNVGQAGGLVRATNANAYLSGVAPAGRKIGIKVIAGAATHVPGKNVLLVVQAAG